MNKLGFLVSNFGASHQTYCLFRNVNKLLTEKYDTDILLFFENLALPCMPIRAACMQVNEAWGYAAPVIATSLSCAEKLIRFPGPTKKIFYVWDLEWLRFPQKQFEPLFNIYSNPSIELVARALDHKKVLEDAWNRPVKAVVEDFNLEQLMELTGK